MSNRCIPPEICDHIVDFLHGDPNTLKQCCLCSRSWVPRTRKHLFAVVRLYPQDIMRWKKTFLDPSNSPAHHTHTLSVNSLKAVTLADLTEGGWVST
ncbi:hypothetical protein BJ322DRAFT_530596 [Thelephora terrestris]|uniref:F-box domain-containing protein n=1 Tax=Thelephora terrestris TaxID=56493 RepID=A0A9P6HM63_9AGAM|nr:hypothetical protein BJ322DRAFT_530596 [Thelephora terrestris]